MGKKKREKGWMQNVNGKMEFYVVSK